MASSGGLRIMSIGSALRSAATSLAPVHGETEPTASTFRHYRKLYLAAALVVYGALFVVLRSWSADWATFDLFSLWFPAAGLRFAFLWFLGSRITFWAALAELLAGLASATVDLGAQPVLGIVRTVAPCFIYGLVINRVGERRRAEGIGAEADPLVFSAAAMLGSTFACLGALISGVFDLDPTNMAELRELFANVLVFALGDILGILLLAPPLLALANWLVRGTPLRLPKVPVARWIEAGLVLALSWALVALMYELGYGVLLAPVLLATCWAGLRSGRLVAWMTLPVSAGIILPLSESSLTELERLEAHMLLACIVAGGYLVGSYADRQELAAREIRRRDRLLFQAERLKTLRAMSLSIIHEVSQPLSTIALEASSLRKAAASASPDQDDIREMAERIGRKTSDLSELIRRFRRSGESGSEDRSLIGVQTILHDIVDLISPEAERAGVSLTVSAAPDVLVEVSDVEVRQALLNLLRNALAASPAPGGTIWLSCHIEGGDVAFAIENLRSPEPRPAGMRVGLYIAGAIARIHGGTLGFDSPRPGRIRCTFRLPVAKAA